MKKFLLLLVSLISTVAIGAACNLSGAETSDSVESSQTVEVGLQEMEISLSSKSVPYDGKEHSLEIEGELPAKAVVVWQNNSRKDVGEQLVFATVRCAGYKDVSLKGTLTVVGQDMVEGIVLEEESIQVNAQEEYAFKVKDETLLPVDAVLTETYIDVSSGKVVDEKPDFGGEFRYVLQIDAPGYNTKIIHGELTIARPLAERVEITNLPSVAIAKYKGRNALLPDIRWVPEVNVLPQGHGDVEIEFTTSDESRIKFENGAFVALKNYGDCEITVSIKGTEIAATYNVLVPECSFCYEDFEDESKTLYIEQYVIEKGENGKMDYTRDEEGNYVFIPIPRGKEVRLDENGKAERDESGNVLFFDKAVTEAYYGASSSSGTNSEIISQNGNRVLHVSGVENFNPYYSFLEIDACPSGGWEAGTYLVEMEVTGEYPFTFYWTNPTVVGGVEVLSCVGVSADMKAEIVDGKISIEFTIKDANITEGNSLKFAALIKNEFEYTIDNIMILKVK